MLFYWTILLHPIIIHEIAVVLLDTTIINLQTQIPKKKK